MKISILIPVIILLSIVSASSTEVLREISPESPKTGSVIEVKINVLNQGSSQSIYEIEERLPGDVELIEPKEPYETRQQDGIRVQVLKWNLRAEPGKVTSVIYKIKSSKPGQLSFSPIKLIDTLTGELISGGGNEIIVLCNQITQCEKNENYINCPEDCSPGP